MRVRIRSPPTVHPDGPPSPWRHPTKSAGGSPPDAHVGGLRHPTNPAPHGANRADVDRHEGNASEMAPLSRATGTWWTPPGQGSMALFSYQFVSGACRNVIRDSAPRDFLLRTRDPSTAADGARGARPRPPGTARGRTPPATALPWTPRQACARLPLRSGLRPWPCRFAPCYAR